MAKHTDNDLTLKNAITDRILELRIKSGLSQIDFAKAHDMDRQTLNRWENKNNPRGITIHTIKKFCKMVNIPLHEFFNSKQFRD